jgi:hypothetical protein
MRTFSLLPSLAALSALLSTGVHAQQSPQTPPPQPKQVNYDEAAIPPYSLPELLMTPAGVEVKTATDWIQKRRPAVLSLYEQHVFGKSPTQWGKVVFETLALKKDALEGKATRKLVRISLADYPKWQGLEVMLYIPNEAKGPVPCFVGPNFGGNHAVTGETDVPLSSRWMRQGKDEAVVNNRATDKGRGTEAKRWPLDLAMSEGFAVATYYYGDVEPDHPDGWKEGLRGAMSKNGSQTEWREGDWGAIGAWAWGLSRIADYLATEPTVDAKKLAVIGHSRLGKTSLWAGAQDRRFRVVVSNNSGEGGAALMRRNIGETTAVITKAFPHWFTKTYSSYANNESACPVDSHMLVALAAPRAVYIASAVEDRWADPKGEFLSGLHAEPAFNLFGKKGYGVTEQPAIDTPVGDTVAYHIRTGIHDVTRYDWEQYLKFARRHFSQAE